MGVGGAPVGWCGWRAYLPQSGRSLVTTPQAQTRDSKRIANYAALFMH